MLGDAYTCNFMWGGEKKKLMATVKSRHVQSSYLWIVKLQMTLILIIFFCVLHNVCVCLVTQSCSTLCDS